MIDHYDIECGEARMNPDRPNDLPIALGEHELAVRLLDHAGEPVPTSEQPSLECETLGETNHVVTRYWYARDKLGTPGTYPLPYLHAGPHLLRVRVHDAEIERKVTLAPDAKKAIPRWRSSPVCTTGGRRCSA